METERCPADVLSDVKPSAALLPELANELVKSLSELVELLKMQQNIESRRNDILTELLAHNQLIIDRVLASDPPEIEEDEEVREDEMVMGLDGKPIRAA
jgi:hypothetical protein